MCNEFVSRIALCSNARSLLRCGFAHASIHAWNSAMASVISSRLSFAVLCTSASSLCSAVIYAHVKCTCRSRYRTRRTHIHSHPTVHSTHNSAPSQQATYAPITHSISTVRALTLDFFSLNSMICCLRDSSSVSNLVMVLLCFSTCLLKVLI